MKTPGAKRSTPGPQFEPSSALFIQRLPFQSTAPTVKAAATSAGEYLRASRLALPAITTTVTPLLIAWFTALSMPEGLLFGGQHALLGPQRLMFTTLGTAEFAWCSLVTQLTP